MDQQPNESQLPDLESLQAKLASLRPPMPELNWPEIWKEQGRAEVRREQAALASAQLAAASRPRTAWAWPLITAVSLLLAIATSWDRIASITTDQDSIAIAPVRSLAPSTTPVADESNTAGSQDSQVELADSSASPSSRLEPKESESKLDWSLFSPLLSFTINEPNLSWRERLAEGSPGSWEAWEHRDLKWNPTKTRVNNSPAIDDTLVTPVLRRELRSQVPSLFPFFAPRSNNSSAESNSTSGDIL